MMISKLRIQRILWASVAAVSANAVSVASAQPDPVPAQTVAAFDALFGGPRPGRRAVHADGVVVHGDFIPHPQAAGLSWAPHLNGGTIPVVARFSNFSAAPLAPDNAPEASPRGMAVRFLLPDGNDTDIVAHSYNGFPAATPADFLAFLRAAGKPETLAALAAVKPEVRRFIEAPQPAPASYAAVTFHGVNAFRFTNAAGLSRFGRYRLVPLAGEHDLDAAEARHQPDRYLRTQLAKDLAQGPVRFRLLVQLAAEGDPVDDGSQPWPADRPLLELGTLRLLELAADPAAEEAALHFSPTNLVGGIAPSRDPMLLDRTIAYRISGDRRGGDDQ